jgi:hypothetical protein
MPEWLCGHCVYLQLERLHQISVRVYGVCVLKINPMNIYGVYTGMKRAGNVITSHSSVQVSLEGLLV